MTSPQGSTSTLQSNMAVWWCQESASLACTLGPPKSECPARLKHALDCEQMVKTLFYGHEPVGNDHPIANVNRFSICLVVCRAASHASPAPDSFTISLEVRILGSW
jgi:hypothetical protein